MVAVVDMSGLKIGNVTVLNRHGTDNNRATWKCQCNCGSTRIFTGVHLRRALRNNSMVSCGCKKSEVCSQNGKLNTTHGLSKKHKKLYDVYKQMKYRCYEPSNRDFKNYGGRGIKVCDEWHDIHVFFEWAKKSGYKDNITIERIDVDGDYCPSNCTWIENEKQALNKTNSIRYTYKGKSQDIRSWAEEYGLNYYTLRGRLRNYGWDISTALTTPVRK